MSNPVKEITDVVKKDFILFLTLFLPMGIFIVAIIIATRKFFTDDKTVQ